jgi:hypothetical protein
MGAILRQIFPVEVCVEHKMNRPMVFHAAPGTSQIIQPHLGNRFRKITERKMAGKRQDPLISLRFPSLAAREINIVAKGNVFRVFEPMPSVVPGKSKS